MNRSLRPVIVTGLTITSSQDSGSSTAFSVTSAFPLTVRPETRVAVNVLFHPIRTGTITGTVSVTCDDPVLPRFAVPLRTSATARGPHGLLRSSPPYLDLGTVRVGQPIGRDISLTNIGTRDLYVDSLEVVDSSPADQFAVPSSFQRQLAQDQSESIYVSCAPTRRGRLTARLSADISSATNTTQPFQQHLDVPLAVTALAPEVFLADTALSGGPPPSQMLQKLDFGTAEPGKEARRTFWIRNVGDAPLSVSGVLATGRDSFGIPDATIFPAVLAPGGELAVEANFFAPPVAGRPAVAELWIQTDDPFRPRAVLTVTGRAAGRHLTLQPPEVLDLGSGSRPGGSLTLMSDGSEPLTILKVGVDDPDFSLQGFPRLPFTLARGTSLTVAVSYTGTNPGKHNGRMVLAHDAVDGETRVFLKAVT